VRVVELSRHGIQDGIRSTGADEHVLIGASGGGYGRFSFFFFCLLSGPGSVHERVNITEPYNSPAAVKARDTIITIERIGGSAAMKLIVDGRDVLRRIGGAGRAAEAGREARWRQGPAGAARLKPPQFALQASRASAKSD